MKIFHKLFLVCAILGIFLTNFTVGTFAEEETYTVAETGNGTIESLAAFKNYSDANTFYKNNVDEYINLAIYKNDIVIKMEYGIVEFKKNDACSLNVGYRSNTNGDAYLNGCYASDAVYLGESNNGQNVYFKVSGDTGTTSIDDVILHPYQLSTRPSTYSNIDGVFYHHIKRDMANDYYADNLALDNSLSYLEDNKLYYSYDGHYFYDNFITMSDDYKNDTYENAVNVDNPYYNYYQYLSFRSLSNYQINEVEDYFYNNLGIIGKLNNYNDSNDDGANDVVNRSQYYGEIEPFFTYQYIYGTNAMMLLAVSRNESSDGKSYASYKNNNVYSNVAYQSELEKNEDKYISIDDSIKAFAKSYISNRYANYNTNYYKGLFLGNKASGINVRYTSDPYWGEKAASIYYLMDKTLGFKDYGSYTSGIIKDEEIDFYKDENLNDLYFSISDIDDYSVLILQEKNDSYKVQIDPSFNSDYNYDFETRIAYIEKDIVDYLYNQNSIHENEFDTFTVDLDGGAITGTTTSEIKLLKGSDVTLIVPTKDGYVFDKYQTKNDLYNDTNTYVANYQEIKEIKLTKKFNTTVMLNGDLDLSDGEITVYYVGGKKDEIAINTNMISGYDSSIAGEQEITIIYCGVSTTATINVFSSAREFQDEIFTLISNNIETYKTTGSYSSTDIEKIKKNFGKVNYDDSFENIRLIDEMLLEEYRSKTNYRINDGDEDLSVSGLMLSLADLNITSIFKILPDTYYVNLSGASKDSIKNVEVLANSYGFEIVDSFNLDFTLNMKELELDGPIIVSKNIDDKSVNKIYTVYRVDDNENIVKCKTEQSAGYIDFKTDKGGDFIVLEKDSLNTYDFNDYKENITDENSDPDSQGFFIIGSVQVAFMLMGIALIIVNNMFEKKRNEIWKDYKKLLQKVVIVQEEKLKN